MNSLWEFLKDVLKLHGSTAAILIFLVFVFWRLIWKVWSDTLESKNQEIDRLVKERDKYQGLVFERLLSAAPPPGPQKDSKKEGR